MKQIIIILVISSCFSSCTNQPNKESTIVKGITIHLIDDLTDKKRVWADCKEVLRLYQCNKYPEASFIGKIIEDIDFTRDGIYEVRAKGKLWIHGIGSERIIKSTVTVNRGKTTLESHFSVMLSDHNIKVPKVVHEKVASEINVTIIATIQKK